MFKALTDNHTRLLKGQLCLVCAAPGSGKSIFVLTLAAKSGISTLYFSPDSDKPTQLSRLLSISLGWDSDRAKDRVNRTDVGTEGLAAFRSTKVRFDFRSSLTLPAMEQTLRAYDEVYGDYPSLIIVDNVTNVRTELNAEDPFAGLEVVMEELHEMARETGACVIGLHHVQGQYNDGDKPIPLGGIKGQIARVPETVLTLHRGLENFGQEQLRVSTVKQRANRMDPSGQSWVGLSFDGDRMAISDPA